MKIPYNILIQIKMSVRPYFKGFTLIFFFYNCRKQDYIIVSPIIQQGHLTSFMIQNFFILQHKKKEIFFQISFAGVRQLKIHKSSKSGLVAAFFVSSP